MLPGSGFGNKPSFTHPLGKKSLSDRIINLVGSRVVKILPFQINIRTIEPTETFCPVEWSRTSHIIMKQTVKFFPETFIVYIFAKRSLQFLYVAFKNLGNECASEFTVVAVFING